MKISKKYNKDIQSDKNITKTFGIILITFSLISIVYLNVELFLSQQDCRSWGCGMKEESEILIFLAIFAIGITELIKKRITWPFITLFGLLVLWFSVRFLLVISAPNRSDLGVLWDIASIIGFVILLLNFSMLIVLKTRKK